jgi:3-O-methylgallate 3,4-dioxygenase
MAEVVLAAAASHTPMVCMQPEDWAEYALGDRRNAGLIGVDGVTHTFDELVAINADRMQPELTLERFTQRSRTAQDALDRLAASLARVAPDAVIIVGDDQSELFGPEGQPSMAMYWGETVEIGARNALAAVLIGRPVDSTKGWQHDIAVGQGIDQLRSFPVAAQLARNLVEQLNCSGFDVASIRATPGERKFGHAFGFVVHRLLGDGRYPVVPLVLNTFYPPNQPTPARCVAVGRALRAAIEAHASDARVALVASGGLSHFVVDEALDRQVMSAIETRDWSTLSELPLARINSGTSEVRNWITVAAAADPLSVTWSAYEPAYRTPAATGCGLGFMEWS